MSTRIERILTRWDAIADHRTGSPGDRQTADWLVGELAEAGIAASLECFPFRRRIVRESWIEIDGTRIDGLPCFDGGATATPIDGRLAPIGGIGEIAVGTFSPATLDADTRALAAARNSGAHRALIAISSGRDVRPGLAVINAEAYAEPLPTPVLQVATEHRERLEAAAREGHPTRYAAPR